MKRKFLVPIVSLILLSVLAGCVPMHVYSNRVGTPDLSKIHSLYVIKNEEDTGGLEKVVADELTQLGLQAQIGPAGQIPENVDATVTYEFQWFWDLGTYLLMLKVHIRDAETNFPYAMGESLRTSLARKPPEEMAREILTPIFNPAGVDESETATPKPKPATS